MILATLRMIPTILKMVHATLKLIHAILKWYMRHFKWCLRRLKRYVWHIELYMLYLKWYLRYKETLLIKQEGGGEGDFILFILFFIIQITRTISFPWERLKWEIGEVFLGVGGRGGGGKDLTVQYEIQSYSYIPVIMVSWSSRCRASLAVVLCCFIDLWRSIINNAAPYIASVY